MKIKRFFRIGYIILIITVFFVIAIYLPEMDAGILEKQHMNQCILVKQDKQEEGIHYDLPLVDKLSILSSSDQSSVSTEIISIQNIADLEEQDAALLEGLESDIKLLEELKVIPQLVTQEQLRECFNKALYYNISNIDNSGVVPVWKLTFYEPDTLHYQFIIDANTYKIYSVCIFGYEIADFLSMNEIYTDREDAGQMEYNGYNIGKQLKNYYEADNFQILDITGGLGVVGVLDYVEQDIGKPDAQIPCNIYYYYPGEIYMNDMEGMFVGITNTLEEMSWENVSKAEAD